ncbi:hypothetical protein ANCCAN_26586 [Ancylostoma caninum]|uniref:Uncharacterized protein n=1 Tax=Ancylostoma caninum TaxID=29170 RepID=A0A368FBX5_ANCCA|nr:hypothetical protein ANCCAN_26586 [Ancylostoma caninum]
MTSNPNVIVRDISKQVPDGPLVPSTIDLAPPTVRSTATALNDLLDAFLKSAAVNTPFSKEFPSDCEDTEISSEAA